MERDDLLATLLLIKAPGTDNIFSANVRMATTLLDSYSLVERTMEGACIVWRRRDRDTDSVQSIVAWHDPTTDNFYFWPDDIP